MEGKTTFLVHFTMLWPLDMQLEIKGLKTQHDFFNFFFHEPFGIISLREGEQNHIYLYRSNYVKGIISFNHIMHVGWFMTLEYVNYIFGASNKVRVFVFYSYVQANTWKFGQSYAPNIIHRIHYSSQYYSHERFSFSVLFIKNTIHSNTITRNTNNISLFTMFLLFVPALFIICTGINFFLFSKFLPMKVIQWRPMSIAKYRMEHNHAGE